MTNFSAKSPAAPSPGRHTKNLSIAVSPAPIPFSTNVAGLGPVDASYGQVHAGKPRGLARLSLGAGNKGGQAVTLQPDGKTLLDGDRVNGGSADRVVLRVMNR